VSGLQHVEVSPLAVERFRDVVAPAAWAEIEATIVQARAQFAGRVIWNVSSTANGGGVAEMLHSLLAYARGAGVDARWAVIPGDERFFRITKRIHNRLHGAAGDGGALGPAERAHYDRTLAPSAAALAALVHPGDVVLVHDPQPAGLVEPLTAAGATVVWRCHVGIDHPNDHAREAWAFLLEDVRRAAAAIFSRDAYVWDGIDRSRVVIVPPSIDAFSAKNQWLSDRSVAAILTAAGISDGRAHPEPTFTRRDGSPGRVDRRAAMLGAPMLDPDAPLVCQVSRWDRLKDHAGVLTGFADHVLPSHPDAQLVLVGPAAAAVSDDPEGLEVLDELVAAHRALAPGQRARVAIASLPMDDAEENAAMVNALQRCSTIVVQKSLAEGFGLTVAEAMWKARPLVAGRVGGIQDQVVDGETGLLVEPTDLAAFGASLGELLGAPERARAMGDAARARALEHYLAPRQLTQWVRLLAGVNG
jgi:trehalose synthase